MNNSEILGSEDLGVLEDLMDSMDLETSVPKNKTPKNPENDFVSYF